MKIKSAISLFFLVFLAQAVLWSESAVEPAVESKDVLWYEDFSNLGESDSTCTKLWRTKTGEGEIGVNISHEGNQTKFSLTRDGYSAIHRIVILPKSSVLDGLLLQVKVTSVSNRMMMWCFNKVPAVIVSGERPGLWTLPIKYKGGAEIPLYIYQIGQVNAGYVEMEYMRLVVGFPEKTVIWKREQKEEWDVPIKLGEKLTVQANLGKGSEKPMLNFIHTQFNTWSQMILTGDSEPVLNDDGKEGDEVAGDGIWSVQFILEKAAEKSVVAKVSTGEEGADLYGECPWPLPKK